jgi:hypothetical protein
MVIENKRHYLLVTVKLKKLIKLQRVKLELKIKTVI